MKFISYNFVAILFICLAALFVLLNKDGWGWCIFAALCTASMPGNSKEDKIDDPPETIDEE